jgi:hypothetical protein
MKQNNKYYMLPYCYGILLKYVSQMRYGDITNQFIPFYLWKTKCTFQKYDRGFPIDYI